MSFKESGEAANYDAYIAFRNHPTLLKTRSMVRESLHNLSKLAPSQQGNVDAIYLATILSRLEVMSDLDCRPPAFFMTSTESRFSLLYPSRLCLNAERLRFLSPIEGGESDIKWNQRYLRKKQNQLRRKLVPDWSLRNKFAQALQFNGMGFEEAGLISSTYPMCYLEGASSIKSDLNSNVWSKLPEQIEFIDSTLWSFSANPWAQSLLSHQHIRLCYHQHGAGSEFLPSLPGFVAERDGVNSFVNWGLGSINARPFRFDFTLEPDNSQQPLKSVLLLGFYNPETALPYEVAEICELVERMSRQSELAHVFIHPLSSLSAVDFPRSIDSKIHKGIKSRLLRKENLHFILDSNLHTLLYFCISTLKPFDILWWKCDDEVHHRVVAFKKLLIELKVLHESSGSVRLSGSSSRTKAVQDFLYGGL